MITLFRCLDCEQWSKWAFGEVEVEFCVEVALRPLTESVDFELAGDNRMSVQEFAEVESTADLRCTECEGPLEMIEMENCPHCWDWPVKEVEGQKRRTCSLCSETQVRQVVIPGGKVQWTKEEKGETDA